MPSDEEKVTFIKGLKTIGGHGDPTQKEGVAVHSKFSRATLSVFYFELLAF
jgi:homogentisate 1,2-dioxygenase